MVSRIQIIKMCLISVIIFITSIYFAFYFEAEYTEQIRNLFSAFTNNKITFLTPRKYFHFASNKFVLTYGLFNLSYFLLFLRQKTIQRVKNIFLTGAVFFISTLIISYIVAFGKLIECTACDDGKRELYYNDVDYDNIFLICLLLSLIPSVIVGIKNFRQSRL